MKQIINFLFVMIFILSAFVACESNASGEASMSTNRVPFKISQASPEKLPIELGRLHNAAMKEFVVYCEKNDITPFKGSKFSDDTYMEFAKKYVEEHLVAAEYPDYWRWQEEASKLSPESVHKVVSQLKDIIFDSDKENVVPKIEEIIKYEQGNYNTEGELIMIESFCNLAIYSYTLWNFKWDWTMSPLIPRHLAYTANQNNEDNKEGDDKSEKEDQTEMKSSDYNTKKIAFVDLMGGVEGAALGGGWPGFAVGAIVASLTEYVVETMDAVAIAIDPKDVDKESYFYSHLLNKYIKNKDAFCKMYGNKFEGIIY